jgi:transposase
MSLPKDDRNTTVLNIDDELRVRIIDKLLTTGRLVAEIAEEFQVRQSLVVQVGYLVDIDVVKREQGLKLHRQAYDILQKGKEAKATAQEMFRDSIREALAKRLVEAGVLHGMDPLELEDHRIAKEVLAEIEAEGSDIPENMPSLEKELYDADDGPLPSWELDHDAYENDLGSTEDLQ